MPRWTAAALASAIVCIAVPVGAAWADVPAPSSAILPVPIDAGPLPNASANDVSCPTAGNCTAVGDYEDTIGIPHAMALKLAAGTWTATPILAPNNAPDYTVADLNSVSCVSVGNCVAVGDYTVSTVKTEGFYAVETAGVWVRGVVLPLPVDAASNPAQTTFLSASCVPGGVVCMLLGEYTAPSSIVHSVVDTFTFGTGITGIPVEFSPTAGQVGLGLDSISCVDANHCVAVGAQVSANAEEAVYVTDQTNVWSSAIALSNPHGASPSSEFLSSVSCVSIGNCVAAGNWLDNNINGFGETYTEAGGVWGAAVNIPQPSNLNNPFVDDISCVATTTSCTIVGALSDNSGGLHAASAQMTGGHWGQLAPASVPGGAVSDHELLAVWCSTGVECTGVGYYSESNRNTQGMAATWAPGPGPGHVGALHATGATTSSVQLAWSAPGSFGSGLAHYEVTARLLGGPAVDKGPFLATGGTITKLVPGGKYTFTVVTVATDGQTSAGILVTKATLPTTPTAPKITRVIGVHRGLRVLWSAPTSTGGATITSYKVTTNCGGSVRSARFAGAARQGTVSGLRTGGNCLVHVAAANKVGSGPQSKPATGRPLS